MIEKNGIDAKSGRKRHISDEDLVGIPKFYNEEHDFYSYNLFDFHKFGLPLSNEFILETLDKCYLQRSNNTTLYPQFGHLNSLDGYYVSNVLNWYDKEIVKNVTAINDYCFSYKNYPEVTLADLKNLYINTMLKELLSMKNEKSLFFLSGGMDSLTLLLLAKSINLPMTCVYLQQDYKKMNNYVNYLKTKFSLDLDIFYYTDIDLSETFKKRLSFNPAPINSIGSGNVTLLTEAVSSLDKYKEYDNIITGCAFWGRRVGVSATQKLYKSIQPQDFEKQLKVFNKSYGYYRQIKPDFKMLKKAKSINTIQNMDSQLRNQKSLYNLEAITNKYVNKSYLDSKLNLYGMCLVDKIDLVKAIYKVPQKEICQEIDKTMTSFPSFAETGLHILPYNSLYNSINWFVNYEKARRKGGVAL